MCMSCGCKQFGEDHGDPRNLTMKHFQDAATAAGTDVQQVARNINEGFQSAGGTSGTSGEYTGPGMGQPGRGSGGFDDGGRTGSYKETATEKSMTGSGGSGREGQRRPTGNQ